jgi:hypothetical protein
MVQTRPKRVLGPNRKKGTGMRHMPTTEAIKALAQALLAQRLLCTETGTKLYINVHNKNQGLVMSSP